MKWIRELIIFFFVLFVTGCASHKDRLVPTSNIFLPQVKWQSDTFTRIEVPQVHDIFHLNENTKQHFLTFYNAPENQAIGGHKRLAQYVSDSLSGFTYRGDTYNADLASTEQAGNCLSLAILTKAYASLVGLKIEYRKVNSQPVYARENGIITTSSHVQTHVHAPSQSNQIRASLRFPFQKLS